MAEGVTDHLIAWRRGDPEAARRVFEMVYDELRTLARRLGRGRPGQTLSTTALVHEVYLKLSDHSRLELEDRRHFFSVAAQAMRQIAVDHWRRRSAAKRGGGAPLVEIGEALPEVRGGEPDVDIDALDQALGRLAERDRRLAQVVELRFFGGLSLEEIAPLLGLSESTLKRDWRKARAFLYRELTASSS